MAKVLISIKIFPTGTEIDLNQLKQTIERKLPKDASAYGFGEEPIAFGLNALIAHILIPEDKSGGLEELENHLRNIEGISQIETYMVQRV